MYVCNDCLIYKLSIYISLIECFCTKCQLNILVHIVYCSVFKDIDSIWMVDHRLNYDLHLAVERYEQMRDLLPYTDIEWIMSNTNQLYDALKEILGMTDENESELIEELEICMGNFTMKNFTISSEPVLLLQKLSASISSFLEVYNNESQPIHNNYDDPEYDIWTEMFRNKLEMCVENQEHHAAFIENITQTMQSMIGKFNSIVTNCTEQLSIAREMEIQWQRIPGVFSHIQGPLNDTCVYDELLADPRSEIEKHKVLEENEEQYALVNLLGSIAQGFINPFFEKQPTLKHNLINPFQHYLKDKKAAKTELYIEISSASYEYLIVNFQQILMDMEFALTDTKEDFAEFIDAISIVFKLIYELPIPVMTDKAVKTKLASLQLFKDEFQDDPLIRNLTEQVLDLGLNGSTAFSHLMEAVTDYYVSRFTTVQEQIPLLKDKFLREFGEAASNLASFANPESQITKP